MFRFVSSFSIGRAVKSVDPARASAALFGAKGTAAGAGMCRMNWASPANRYSQHPQSGA